MLLVMIVVMVVVIVVRLIIVMMIMVMFTMVGVGVMILVMIMKMLMVMMIVLTRKILLSHYVRGSFPCWYPAARTGLYLRQTSKTLTRFCFECTGPLSSSVFFTIEAWRCRHIAGWKAN